MILVQAETSVGTRQYSLTSHRWTSILDVCEYRDLLAYWSLYMKGHSGQNKIIGHACHVDQLITLC